MARNVSSYDLEMAWSPLLLDPAAARRVVRFLKFFRTTHAALALDNAKLRRDNARLRRRLKIASDELAAATVTLETLVRETRRLLAALTGIFRPPTRH